MYLSTGLSPLQNYIYQNYDRKVKPVLLCGSASITRSMSKVAVKLSPMLSRVMFKFPDSVLVDFVQISTLTTVSTSPSCFLLR